MIITDRIIYFQLQKTGCTYTGSVLSELFADSQVIGKHNTYHSVPESVLGDFASKLKIGNIRNPWDWYVSLWTYGCEKKGGLYQHLTGTGKKQIEVVGKKWPGETRDAHKGKSELSPQDWERLYSDATNTAHFNTWLQLILTNDQYKIRGNFNTAKLSSFIGLFTYRYLHLYSYKNAYANVENLRDLIKTERSNHFIDFIIPMEQIHERLFELAEKLPYNKHKLAEILDKYSRRINDTRRDRDYRKYYTEDSALLVEQYDQLIVDKYGYTFER